MSGTFQTNFILQIAILVILRSSLKSHPNVLNLRISSMDGKTSYDLKPRSNLEETNLLKFKCLSDISIFPT